MKSLVEPNPCGLSMTTGDSLDASTATDLISTRASRIAIICDLLEENWHSMDLVAEMLLSNLRSKHSSTIAATQMRPIMKRHFGLPGAGGNVRASFNANRLINRFWDYPRWLKKRVNGFDLFHIIDHSYSHLAHGLPPERTIITCHDLDTFRCLLEPSRDRRGIAFRTMTKRILDGFRKAARVVCVSAATRDELTTYGLIPAERIVVVHNGAHPACSPNPDPASDAEAARLLGFQTDGGVDILHVGSTIPRKRIDALLHIFASLLNVMPSARLIRVGGPFTGDQAELVERLKLSRSIIVLPFLDRSVLAAVYRRAALVLQPSESEGFGLPVLEAMSCGAPVIASDLAVMREVGGDAVRYCPVGDLPAWHDAIIKLLDERTRQAEGWSSRRQAALAQADKFSWTEHARKLVAIYKELLQARENNSC